ncbi:hypothetical protein [Streptomyces sp. SP18CS02]|uniref:hypothetical protein n=1 Tax=Streptomyces sp. SP18CS02 TaxID=3002531 RepID=UPI002E7A9258|nr:hypothetical protein [Streptomyces sp. SP18CS02]MEE1754030.1 hypothetical protein [Streptomyces sp. SP18CS02]
MRPGRRYAWGAALVLAALFCGTAGWSYARTAGDETRAYAQTRDTVLSTGRQHLARLSSFDASRADAGLEQWLDASAGALHEELKRTRPRTEGTGGTGGTEGTGTSARATVTDAALTALDTRAGTAELIATVDVVLTPAGGPAGRTGQPGTDRKRLEATLTRTEGGWKVTALTAVPVAGA